MSPLLLLLCVTTASPAPPPPPPKDELPAAVRALIEGADSVELYSLDARPLGLGAGGKAAGKKPAAAEISFPPGGGRDETGGFHGRKVLGKTVVAGEKARRVLLDQILGSLPPCPNGRSAASWWSTPGTGCAVKRGGESVDLVIDFTWRGMTAHAGGKRLGPFAISRDAQAGLDRLLKDAGAGISKARLEEDSPSVAKTVLGKWELVEVYSLDPSAAKGLAGERFHGYKVLGKLAVEEAGVRKRLVGAIAEAVVPDAYNDGLMGLCFSPRHGYRMRHEGATIDLLICFECHTFKVAFAGDTDRLKEALRDVGWRKVRLSFALYECKALGLVDDLLRGAKIPLVKKRGE